MDIKNMREASLKVKEIGENLVKISEQLEPYLKIMRTPIKMEMETILNYKNVKESLIPYFAEFIDEARRDLKIEKKKFKRALNKKLKRK